MGELKTHYFQFIWYPQERPLLEQEIWRLGPAWVSPLHRPGDQKKPHYHVIIRYPKKTTANVFIADLCEKLNNDFTGVNCQKEFTAVNNIKEQLRYNLHLDIPFKEQFDLETMMLNTNASFAGIVAQAFDVEIREMLTSALSAEIVEDFEEVTMYGGRENRVIRSWLMQGRNMQYVYNMLIAQKVKEYKTNVKCRRNHN